MTFYKLYYLDSSHAFLMVPMAHSLAIPWKLSLSTIPRVCTPGFLALVGCQKVLLQSTLRILLELVLTTSPPSFHSLFSKLEGHGGELGIYQSVVLYSAGLCESAKLEVGVGTSLIYQRCRSVTGWNMVAFTRDGVRDVQANLSAAKVAVNAKVTKDLLGFVRDNGRGDKVPSGVTDTSGEKNFSTVFF